MHKEIFDGDRGDKNRALQLLYPEQKLELVPQWAIAAAIVDEVKRQLKEEPCHDSLKSLGTDAGGFLAELLPVPQQSNRAKRTKDRRITRPKIYPVHRFGFKGTTSYYRAALGRNVAGKVNRDDSADTTRWKALRNLVHNEQRPPEFIICYGVTWRAVFDQLVEPWKLETDDTGHKCIRKLGINNNGSLVAITGFFTKTARPDSQDVTLDDCSSLVERLCQFRSSVLYNSLSDHR